MTTPTPDTFIPFVPEGTGFAGEDCGMQCKAQNVDGSLTPSRLCNAAMRPQDRSQAGIFGYEGYIPFVPEGTGFAGEDCGMQCKAQNVDGSLTPSRLCNAAMRPEDRSQADIFGYEGYVDRHGWLTNAEQIQSPNFDSRPQQEQISLIVIHAISLPAGSFGGPWIKQLFTNTLDTSAHPSFSLLKNLLVSTHFFINRQGHASQYVSCDARAWHAGVSRFLGRQACNDFSIGIELEGSDYQAFTEQQYQCLVGIIQKLCTRYPIRAICGHEHIAPGRKTDPGPFFSWQRLIECSGLPRRIFFLSASDIASQKK